MVAATEEFRNIVDNEIAESNDKFEQIHKEFGYAAESAGIELADAISLELDVHRSENAYRLN